MFFIFNLNVIGTSVKMVYYIDFELASIYDHMKITTKLQNNHYWKLLEV